MKKPSKEQIINAVYVVGVIALVIMIFTMLRVMSQYDDKCVTLEKTSQYIVKDCPINP